MHHDLRVAGLPSGNNTVKTGHTLRFYCNNDKLVDGPEETQCLESGEWSSPFPTCAGVLTSHHRERQHLQCRCDVILMKRCVFCQTEYCRANSLPINVIANGNQVFPLIARPGQKLAFGCSRSGQYLQGAKEVECLATGLWSHPFPTCGGKQDGLCVHVCARTYN